LWLPFLQKNNQRGSKMQDLYKGFKKVNEDDSRAVLKHENGHELVIAKGGISKKQRKALDKLPIHQAEGTPTEEENQMTVPELDSGDALKNIGAQITEAVAQKVIQGAEESISPQQIAAMPEPTATDVATGEPVYRGARATPAEEPGPRFAPKRPLPPTLFSSINPLAVPDYLPGETGNQYAARKQREYDEYQAAQRGEVTEPVAMEPGEQGPGILGAAAPSLQEPVPTTTEEVAEQVEPTPERRPLDLGRPLQAPAITRPPEEVMVDPNVSEADRANAFIMAAQNVQARIEQADIDFRTEMRKPENQINPDRLYENMSTGKKIRTMIGILLGGAAGGILRQENPVMAMLNKQIERDIESQRASRADKMNLYKQNLDILKDGRAAYFQTATQLRGIVEMKLQDAKLKLDPNNIAGRTAIDAAIAENRLKAQQAKEGLAKFEMRKAYDQAQQEGKLIEVPDRLDERLESAVRVTDQKGRSVKLYARNKGAVSDLQKRSDAIASAESALRRIIDFNNKYGRQLEVVGIDVLGEMPAAAEALNAEARIAISSLLSTGQISERNVKLFEDILPKAGQIKLSDAAQKAAQSAKLLKDMKDLLIKNNLTR